MNESVLPTEYDRQRFAALRHLCTKVLDAPNPYDFDTPPGISVNPRELLYLIGTVESLENAYRAECLQSLAADGQWMELEGKYRELIGLLDRFNLEGVTRADLLRQEAQLRKELNLEH